MRSRRQFIATASAAFSAVPLLRAQDPNRKMKTVLIGSGWWGLNILREALATGRSECTALCDVDPAQLNKASEDITSITNASPKLYRDYRELLDKEKPEVVIIATPDHWHALQAIAALKAGAHVFVEKPTAHTVNESRAMVRVARESGKTVQVGLHRRIGPHHVNAHQFLRSGKVGKVGMVRCFVHSGGGTEQPRPNGEPPDGMDWDLYCGPAPLRPFNSRIHPGGWRMFMDYANGIIGDWGVHWLDQILMWSEEKGPRSVFSAGSRPLSGPPVLTTEKQTTDAPEVQTAIFQFENFTATWENRRFGENESEKHPLGVCFYGTSGTLHIGWRDGWTFYPAKKGDAIIHENHQLQEPDGHNLRLLWDDFLKAIDSKTSPVANLEAAHRSSLLPMLANASMKLGRSITWNPDTESIPDDPAASALLSRKYRGPWEYPA